MDKRYNTRHAEHVIKAIKEFDGEPPRNYAINAAKMAKTSGFQRCIGTWKGLLTKIRCANLFLPRGRVRAFRNRIRNASIFTLNAPCAGNLNIFPVRPLKRFPPTFYPNTDFQ